MGGTVLKVSVALHQRLQARRTVLYSTQVVETLVEMNSGPLDPKPNALTTALSHIKDYCIQYKLGDPIAHSRLRIEQF